MVSKLSEKMRLVIPFVLCVFLIGIAQADRENSFLSFMKEQNKLNERPIIGIWTQPRNQTYDYMMASYVKFAEMAGARVVPLMYNDTDENLIKIVSQINGVIYPGGAVNLINKNGTLTEYSRKGKVVLDKIKEMNDQGIHFPVFGIWLGMEEIAVIEATYPDVLEMFKFDADDVANNVTFSEDLPNSKLYRNMPADLLLAMQNENITYNHHINGIFPKTFTKYPALREYLMLAVAYDEKGLEYAATYEHKKYPIYAFQYHPEKNGFIWKSDLKVPHSQNAIDLMQFYANYFVGEARMNHNKFNDGKEERRRLIQNYPIEFTHSSSEDIYIFKR